MSVFEGIRRFFHRMAESDEQRLREEIHAWASSIPVWRRSPTCRSERR